jgi:hypothetical protein
MNQSLATMLALSQMGDNSNLTPFLQLNHSFRNYPSNNTSHSSGKKAKSLKKRSNCRKRQK